MINNPVLPIQDVVPDETVAEVNELPEDHNYAEDKDVLAFVKGQVFPVVRFIVANRTSLSESWAENRRMDLLIHDKNQGYRGRSNNYIPAWAKANNTLISQMSSGLFPTDEYLDCAAMGDASPEEAALMKAYAQYQFGDVAKLPWVIKPFLREMNNTGTGVLKYGWNKSAGRNVKRDPSSASGYGPDKRVAYNEGLYVSARSIHNVYVYPVTAEHARELQLVTEVVSVPNSFVKQMGREKKWKNIEMALNNKSEMNAVLEAAKLIGEKDNLSPDASNPISEELGMTYILETYTYMKLPEDAYLDGEDTEALLPVQIFSVGGTPLCVRRNPNFHQSMPYLFGRANTHAGSFYGIGFAQYVRGLQHQCNDFANQGNDAATYALNPIIKMNPAFIVGTPPKIRPGVVWKLTDIRQGVEFDRPPTELITAGQSLLSYYSAAVADFGGAPPVLQGRGGGGGARTATGTQVLQRNALQPLQDQIEDLEGDVMVPLMKRLQCLARQFQDRELGLLVGGASKVVSPDVFDKEFEFRWLASSQMVNQQMRSQQVMTFVQSVAPLIPLIQQQGYVFDPVPLFKKVYYDGFGFRGFDEIFKKAPMQVGGMGGPGMSPIPGQQAPGAQSQSQSQSQPSAFPGGEQMENPVPGEGDQFNAANSPEQQLAGFLGGMGGESM